MKNSLTIYDYIFETKENEVSLPLEINNRMLELKKEYLTWIYEFGESEIEGKKIKDCLFEGGLSFWWLSLIAEKSIFKTPEIYAVLKLRTMEKIIQEKQVNEMLLLSDDDSLKKPILEWATKKNIKVRFNRTGKELVAKKGATYKILESMPQIIQAFICLGSIWFKRIRKIKKSEPAPAKGEITIFTYFPNIDMELAKKDIFLSRYWETLPSLLKEMKKGINWVLMYSDSSQMSYSETVLAKERFQKNSDDRFMLLEESLDQKKISAIVHKYFLMRTLGKKLMRKELFKFSDSEINFYCVLENAWKSSIVGKTLMENLIFRSSIRGVLDEVGPQNACLYLCEMMAWEKILVNECETKGITSIGFGHASIRTADLRYYHDPRTYADKSESKLPLPSLMAVNGEIARKEMLNNQYPKQKIEMVEALRHLYILNSKESDAEKMKIMLVVMGYKKADSELQLSLLTELIEQKMFERIWIKPHPDFQIEEIVSKLNLVGKVEIKNVHLSKLIPECEMVYTSNETAACIESVYLKKPTISVLPLYGLNMSPLFGQGLEFVHNSQELLNFAKNPRLLKLENDALALDNGLPRWRKIISKILMPKGD